MSLVWFTGGSASLTAAELRAVARHPHSLTWCFVLALALTFIMVRNLGDLPPIPAALGIYLASLIAIVVSVRALAVAAEHAARTGCGRVPASLVQALVAGSTANCGAVVLGHFTQINGDQLLTLGLLFVTLNEIAATLFALLWLPPILAAIRQPHHPDAASPRVSTTPARTAAAGDRTHLPRPVAIGEHILDCADILILEAENEYVSVTGKSSRKLIRARLSDAVQQIPDGLGRRVHRSFWVANGAVAKVEKAANRDLIIHTPLNSQIPVARARRQSVMAWLAEQGIDIQSARGRTHPVRLGQG